MHNLTSEQARLAHGGRIGARLRRNSPVYYWQTTQQRRSRHEALCQKASRWHLQTFGSHGKFEEKAKLKCASVNRLKHRVVDSCTALSLASLPADWARQHGVIVGTRGVGFWRWKAYTILQRLASMGDGEVLVHADYDLLMARRSLVIVINSWRAAHLVIAPSRLLVAPPCADTGLRVPASCVPQVTEAQGSCAACVGATAVRTPWCARTSLGRAGRTEYRGWRPRRHPRTRTTSRHSSASAPTRRTAWRPSTSRALPNGRGPRRRRPPPYGHSADPLLAPQLGCPSHPGGARLRA